MSSASETKPNGCVFAGFRSSYRPPIVTAADAEPVNDAGNDHHRGTVGSLVHWPAVADVADRPTKTFHRPLFIVLAAAILSRVSSIP